VRSPEPLLILLLAACGTPAPPARKGAVVSLLPSWTEVIVDLGAKDRLVGCTDACEPLREVVRVPWQGSVEAIVRLRPELVIRQAPRAAGDAFERALAQAGIRVLSLPSETVADVRSAIGAIGEALGIDARAYLERFDRDLAAAKAKGEGHGEPPSVLLVIGRDLDGVANVDAAGKGTFLDELIRCAGGRNAVDAGPYPKLRLEEIVRLAPEVIIDNAGKAEAWRALPTVPAVRDGRVFAVADHALLIPGPRLPRSVERLAGMIHGRP
jgi:ABC-type hemin transport system substrate-binding protein